ncbi:MAG TPA: WecB/TagA/CpsF family glycosyltransferase [Bryobacteraceae bacterium]|nr:WecB/TagA/CpsF family glycosyltransferase [Bryobacteraceae bacterium]
MDCPRKRRVAGVDISTTSYEEVAQYCAQWIAERGASSAVDRARYICVTSVHGIITAQDEPEVCEILNGADIATPDGMPVVWALRSFGEKQQQRVYGPTLMLHLCESAALHGHRIFLYGGVEESLRQLRARLEQRIPGIQIVGEYSPPFRELTPDENAQVERQILASGADLVFVGISTPKQERWMRAHRATLPGVVMVGVGAAFDFHAGRVRQAPPWMQRRGLEWFFRLWMEPARLWRRYVLVTPRFLPLWAMQWIRFGTEPCPALELEKGDVE